MVNNKLEINKLEINKFCDYILHLTLSKKNYVRSSERTDKLHEYVVYKLFKKLCGGKNIKKSLEICFEKDVELNEQYKESKKCDLVIKDKDEIKFIFMFKFPTSSMSKNFYNYKNNIKAEALDFEDSIFLGNNVKIYFINFIPNIDKMSERIIRPLNSFKNIETGQKLFNKCDNIDIIYDVNSNYDKLKKEYKDNIFLFENNKIVEDHKILNGDLTQISKLIYD